MRHLVSRVLPILAMLCLVLCSQTSWAAAQLKIAFPLGRNAYQTNERIDIAVQRIGTEALQAGLLQMRVTGDDGSQLAFTFPVAAMPMTGNAAQATEHLYLNGWLLRPGSYVLEITCDGATAALPFSVYSHLRRSTFKLIDWGTTAKDAQVQAFGEDGFGFNLLYGVGNGDNSIKGGLDYMGCCTMGGGHQMELRLECDWSDPYVLQGCAGSAAHTAFSFRTSPNAVGVHFYDEPGLTWLTHPTTGKFSPQNIPAQDRAYKAAFDRDVPVYTEVPGNPEKQAMWTQKNIWKQSFMEAAWQLSANAVKRVRPDFISATQTVYGWTSFIDGYYFNIARQLPVISGHGGYDDLWLGYLTPSYFFEMGRARDLNKPNWYLPGWYVDLTSDRFRMEQYMSFVNNLQGMAKPPWIQIQEPTKFPASEGIVESNKLMGRLGTIFTTMPVDRPKVAMLYSLSQGLNAQAKNPEEYGGEGQALKLSQVYIASKLIQTRFFPVVEEDVLDGTVAANHKVVVISGISYLDPRVITALEAFIAKGGAVLMTADCTVKIAGTTILDAAPNLSRNQKIGELWQSKAGKSKEEVEKIDAEIARLDTVGNVYKECTPLANALKSALTKVGVQPDLVSSNPEIYASRQGRGDIEYLFAINASYGYEEAKHNSLKAASSTISIPADGRPVYNAILGGPASEFVKQGQALSAPLAFGPGQMRAYARTARPIGGVQVATPVVFRDYTRSQAPLSVEINAMLVDKQQKVLSGSAPLQIALVDPLNVVRYDLYRATDKGVCTVNLPLAINDPAGQWTVMVVDLLANTVGKATFTLGAPGQCGAAAGMAQRAIYFGEDRQRIFTLFQSHKNATIAIGDADYLPAAAERLAGILKPWGIRTTVVKAADIKARPLSEEEAATWVGHLQYAGKANIKPGAGNPPVFVGYDVEGPVILLGTPQNNPMIKSLADWQFLPYKTDATFPGPGHSLLAWQVEAMGFNQESVAVVAYDQAGMSEGVGSLYEAISGLNPLTPWQLPSSATVQAATRNTAPAPALTAVWSALVPDRPLWMEVQNGVIAVCTGDGSLTAIDATGKSLRKAATKEQLVKKPALNTDVKALPAAKLRKDRVVKAVAAGGGITAVAYWGGTLQTFNAQGALASEQQMPQDISGIVWNGKTLVVGLADGRVLGLAVK